MAASRPAFRWIAHVDLDAFFASCEQRDHPDYRGRPVVVGALPGRRGVVAAASYEARRFGIRSAMPIGEAHRRCPDAVYLRPDMAKYQRVSRDVFAVLETITPVVEAASIDEAYLDLTGLHALLGPPAAIGTEIKARIHQATGLTASVGIGPNRLIAKLGSEYRKPDGLTVVSPEEVAGFLAPMPAANLRGAGRRAQAAFQRLGIGTIADVLTAPPGTLEREIGARAAASFRRQARGIAADQVVPGRARKSISKERTFDVDLTDTGTLHDELRELAAGVTRIARREGLAGRTVTLKVRYTGFDTHTRQQTLARSTQDERMLLKTAWALFTRGDLPAKPVRLIGVGLSDWGADRASQPDLFAKETPAAADQRVLRAIDQVATKFGAGKLQVGLSRKRRD